MAAITVCQYGQRRLPIAQTLGTNPLLMEAEACLTNFQIYKSKLFAFVCNPSTVNAQQLRQERPFLWLGIMAVCPRSRSQQQVLGSKLRRTIAQEMVVQSSRSIDLLLGLLAYIG